VAPDSASSDGFASETTSPRPTGAAAVAHLTDKAQSTGPSDSARWLGGRSRAVAFHSSPGRARSGIDVLSGVFLVGIVSKVKFRTSQYLYLSKWRLFQERFGNPSGAGVDRSYPVCASASWL
jgi:hypothetical protein